MYLLNQRITKWRTYSLNSRGSFLLNCISLCQLSRDKVQNNCCFDGGLMLLGSTSSYNSTKKGKSSGRNILGMNKKKKKGGGNKFFYLTCFIKAAWLCHLHWLWGLLPTFLKEIASWRDARSSLYNYRRLREMWHGNAARLLNQKDVGMSLDYLPKYTSWTLWLDSQVFWSIVIQCVCDHLRVGKIHSEFE